MGLTKAGPPKFLLKTSHNPDTEIDSCWGFYGDYGIKDIIAEAGFNKGDMKEVYCDNIDLDDYFEKIFDKEVKWTLKS